MRLLSLSDLTAVRGGSMREHIRAVIKTIPPGYCDIYLGAMLLCHSAKRGTSAAMAAPLRAQ